MKGEGRREEGGGRREEGGGWGRGKRGGKGEGGGRREEGGGRKEEGGGRENVLRQLVIRFKMLSNNLPEQNDRELVLTKVYCRTKTYHS